MVTLGQITQLKSIAQSTSGDEDGVSFGVGERVFFGVVPDLQGGGKS